MSDTFPLLQVFSGEDRFRRDRAARSAIQELTQAGGSMGIEEMSARGLEASKLATALDTPSLFGGRRVVVLEDGQELVQEIQDLLVEQVEKLREHERQDTAIIITTDGHSPGRKLTSRADVYDKFPSFRRYREAQNWLQQFARQELNIEIGYQVARELVNRVGRDDSGQLAQEVRKLATMSGGKEITLQQVNQATGQVAEVSPYKFYDQVGQRRYAQARTLLAQLLRAPDQSGVRLTVGLSIHLTRLALARAQLDQGLSAQEVAPTFDRKWLGEKYVKQARGWSMPELEQAIHHLNEADLQLKSGFGETHTLTLFLSRALLSA